MYTSHILIIHYKPQANWVESLNLNSRSIAISTVLSIWIGLKFIEKYSLNYKVYFHNKGPVVQAFPHSFILRHFRRNILEETS